MKGTEPVQHEVIHDVAVLAFAGFCGIVGGVVELSAPVGLLMFAVIAALGIPSLRLHPVRRQVERVVARAATGLNRTTAD